ELETEVVVQAAGGVALHDEMPTFTRCRLAGRLGRAPEVALAAIVVERHEPTPSLPSPPRPCQPRPACAEPPCLAMRAGCSFSTRHTKSRADAWRSSGPSCATSGGRSSRRTERPGCSGAGS